MQEQDDPEFFAAQLRKPSGEFARIIGEKMNKSNEFMYDFIIESMDMKSNESVLEIGFGNGRFFNKIFDVSNLIKVFGIDYSEEMVTEAMRRNSDRLSEGNLILKAGSSDNIPFNVNSFDKVFSSMVIYFWNNPEDHLREIHRVLKPGGKFFTGIRSKESIKQYPFSDYGFKLYEVSEWEKILEENKFRIIKTLTKEQQFETGYDFKEQHYVCFIAEKIF